jgi:hypothetical protein
MVRYRIDAKTDDLGPTLGELFFQASDGAQFRGAYGSEVFGVREEHSPAIANPLVKVDGALGGFSRKVRRDIVDTERHFCVSS